MTAWLRPWVGLPYAEGGRGDPGYDCLGLVLAVSKARSGVTLPDPLSNTSDHGTARSRHLREWTPVQRADVREGDVLLFPGEGAGRFHVGYLIDGHDMLHASRRIVGSTVEDWTRAGWLHRLRGIYRYAG